MGEHAHDENSVADGRITLSPVSRAIVHALHIDGRAPFSRIAAVLGVSDQTVARRYRRLRSTGQLRVVGLPNARRLGWVEWFVRVQVTPDAASPMRWPGGRIPRGSASPRAPRRSSASPAPPVLGRAMPCCSGSCPRRRGSPASPRTACCVSSPAVRPAGTAGHVRKALIRTPLPSLPPIAGCRGRSRRRRSSGAAST
ncbi:Lrp/AsnC family transcriptional regulator [Nocardia sp. NPDC004260]